MRVYNLTDKVLDFRGKKISPKGGSMEYGDLTYIPTRDRALEVAGIISIGSLPEGWKKEPEVLPEESQKVEAREEVKVESKLQYGLKQLKPKKTK
jgi:hypothetical protein